MPVWFSRDLPEGLAAPLEERLERIAHACTKPQDRARRGPLVLAPVHWQHRSV
jgi:hypothetical protein